jgi:signal recognition particle receptor subunit beta
MYRKKSCPNCRKPIEYYQISKARLYGMVHKKILYVYKYIFDSSVLNQTERTLFFDFLPLSGGEVRGFKTRFHLYTIPGQTFYEVSRQFILKGVDGIVFVADSQSERMEANIESFESLEKSLEQQGYDLHKLPLVFQYNKRDLTGAVTIKELEATFNPMHRPYFEAIANQGQGVMETLQAISQLVIREMKGEV